jgi:hypothetical protein
MKKLTALAALSMAGLALTATPAQAAGGGAAGSTYTAADLCAMDMAGTPVIGEAAGPVTCHAVGTVVDHPPL